MNIEKLKLYCMNITSFTLALTSLDLYTKIALIGLSLGYTFYKLRKLRAKC